MGMAQGAWLVVCCYSAHSWSMCSTLDWSYRMCSQYACPCLVLVRRQFWQLRRREARACVQVVGLVPVALEALVGAVAAGGRSRLLGQIHIALLRVILADMEDAHASGALQARALSECRVPGQCGGDPRLRACSQAVLSCKQTSWMVCAPTGTCCTRMQSRRERRYLLYGKL